MFLSGLFCSLKQLEKWKKYEPRTHPNFPQNLDENLKIYLVWPNVLII